MASCVYTKIDEPLVGQEPLRWAGVALVYQDTLLLVQKGSRYKRQTGCWGIPGGKIERNESSYDAALRELFEETGIVLQDALPLTSFYAIQEDQEPSIYFHATIFYKRVIQMPAVILEQGHDAYVWCPVHDVSQLSLTAGMNEVIKALYKHVL